MTVVKIILVFEVFFLKSEAYVRLIMNKSLSRSFRTSFGTQHDDALEQRVKPFKEWVKSEYGTNNWRDWEIRFNGTLKVESHFLDRPYRFLAMTVMTHWHCISSPQMIQGDDDENMDVVQRLKKEKFAGKLTLSLLPKLKVHSPPNDPFTIHESCNGYKYM